MDSTSDGASEQLSILEDETRALEREAAFVGRLSELPWATIGLLIVFALCHFVVLSLADGQEERAVFYLLISGAKVNDLVLQGEWWRLLSSAFLHGTFSHLLVNSVGVLLLGWFLENSLGMTALVATFVLSSVVGGIFSTFLVATPSVGASGGMFGLLGATLAFALVRWKLIPRFVRAYVVGLPAVVGIVSLAYGAVAANVDNWAHVGGGLAGLGLGVAFLWTRDARGPLTGFVAGLGRAALVLAVVYSLGTSGAHLALRFDLPRTRLATAGEAISRPHLHPDTWKAGVFREGACMLGEQPADEDQVACYVDPYYSMLLVARSRRMAATPVFVEFIRRVHGNEPELFTNYEILWAADSGRGLEFALLAFKPMAEKYLPLFAAVQARPEKARLSREHP